jgi:peptidoglycan/LPS O-acetylase OafA/YrhL
MISHLWSLAVEEQFYLIWPWIILLANKKYYPHIIFLFILIGVLSQYLLSGVKMSSQLTFTCFDAFGLGSLLSWITTYLNDKLKRFYLIISGVAIICFLFFIWGVIQNEWTFIPLRTIISVITLWLITYIILYQESDSLRFKFILNNSILIFLGKISYGLYLYHNIIPQILTSKIIDKHFNPILPDLLYKSHWGLLCLIENTFLLLIISWLSYVFIEKKFLDLKRYFELR